MSLWYDETKKRYCIRIVRRGHEVRETCPAGTSKSQAQERHDRLARELYERAALGKTPERTISEALVRYVEDHLTPGTTKHTNAMSNIRALLPAIKGKRLADINEVATRYRQDHAQSLKVTTINRRLALLRHVANIAHEDWGWLAKPPRIATGDESGNARHFYLTRGEIELAAFYAGLWHPLAEPYLLIGAYTGMRQGNVLRLASDPSMVRDRCIWLQPGIVKNRAPVVIPLAPRIEPVVASWVGVELPHKRTLYEAYKRAMDAILRPEVTYHDLRHSTASLLIQQRVPLNEVRKLLGHRDMRTTMRYAHLETQYLRGVMENFAPAPSSPES